MDMLKKVLFIAVVSLASLWLVRKFLPTAGF